MGRHIPQGLLRRMFFTGQPIGAEEAYRNGFVQQVVPPAQLADTAAELAGVIAAKAPLGLRMGKEALNEGETMPVDEGYAVEQSYSTKLMHTDAIREVVSVGWGDLISHYRLVRLRVERLGPLTVAIDAHGNNVYENLKQDAARRLPDLLAELKRERDG